MPPRFMKSASRRAALTIAVGLALVLAAELRPALAQVFVNPNQGFRSNVAGVSVDAEGVVRNLDPQQRDEVRRAREKFLAAVPEDLRAGTKLRKVSLRHLQEAALESVKVKGGTLPDEVRYLAGLQRIQYVLVYPELKDIVLVGPAEGWRVDAAGDVVGITSGRPVLLFDDLLVALRTAATHRGPLTCSIDPTREGSQRLQKFLNTRPTIDPQGATLARAQREMGMQQVTLTGIEPSSHFAQVMVAADYRMKRLAMGFDRSPLKDMPSYLELVRAARGVKSQNSPRWWLQDDYQPLWTDGEGLAFELRGQGVKTMTEEEKVRKDGTFKGTGKANPLAQKWADTLTAQYDELSLKETIFGQLRNCMDLSVAATLIASENLPDRAGLDLAPLLTGDALSPDKFEAPRQIPTLANAMPTPKGWLFSASGGVSLDPWQTAARREKNPTLGPVHAESQRPQAATAWRWN